MRPHPRVYGWDEKDSAADALNNTGVVVLLLDVRGFPLDREFSVSMFTAREMERAQRFRLETSRNEYLAARGMVRSLLASRAGVAPDTIAFEASHNRKPQILNPECAGIDVSLSHSDGRVACAFMSGGNIGVDIESAGHRDRVDMNTLARGVLSSTELKALEATPEEAVQRVFLRIWTRKEAVLKAAGVGLSVEPGTFDVLRRSAGGLEELSPIRFAGRLWTCHSRSLDPDLELSVAYSEKN